MLLLWANYVDVSFDPVKVLSIVAIRFQFQNIDIEKHELIVSSHPSPLSFKRSYKNYPSFNNSRPFSTINKYLNNKIEW